MRLVFSYLQASGFSVGICLYCFTMSAYAGDVSTHARLALALEKACQNVLSPEPAQLAGHAGSESSQDSLPQVSLTAPKPKKSCSCFPDCSCGCQAGGSCNCKVLLSPPPQAQPRPAPQLYQFTPSYILQPSSGSCSTGSCGVRK